jgi:hypothetical protein
MMPGGTAEAYKYIEPIVTKVAAQVRSTRVLLVSNCKSAGALLGLMHGLHAQCGAMLVCSLLCWHVGLISWVCCRVEMHAADRLRLRAVLCVRAELSSLQVDDGLCMMYIKASTRCR